MSKGFDEHGWDGRRGGICLPDAYRTVEWFIWYSSCQCATIDTLRLSGWLWMHDNHIIILWASERHADWAVSSLMCRGIEFSRMPPHFNPQVFSPFRPSKVKFWFLLHSWHNWNLPENRNSSSRLGLGYSFSPTMQQCFTLFFSPTCPLNLQQYQQHNGSFVAHCSIIGIASQTAKDNMQLQQRQSQYISWSGWIQKSLECNNQALLWCI